jgi:hypothetical protein
MAESRGITFTRPKYVEPNWQIEAVWPRGHIEIIAGFKSEADADEWLNSRSSAWLKARGYT